MSPPDPAPIRRGFVDGPFGQIHVWMTPPVAGKAPLVLLHPSPYSGAYFHPLIGVLAPGRQLIALDAPGFGASAPPPGPASVGDYAGALAMALEGLDLGGAPLDLMGVHTGAMFAVELAARAPGRVRRLILSGLPFHASHARAGAFAPMAKPPDLNEAGAHLMTYWRIIAESRSPGVTLGQAQRKFADAMAALPHAWRAYEALALYPAETRIPLAPQPVRLLLLNEPLSAHTRAAAPLFPRAETVDLPGLDRDAFEISPAAIAAATTEFLDRETEHV